MINTTFQKALLIFSLAAISPHFAQDIDWEKSYGGKQADYLLDALPTADYGFLLAGSSLSGQSGTKESKEFGHLDYWIWKMDEHGNAEWEKSFGGEGRDMLYSVCLTSDGGFLLGGTSDSPSKESVKKLNCLGQEDFWIVKLDASGNVQWEKTLGGRGSDILTKILPYKGGYLLFGSSSSNISEFKESNSEGGLDYWIVRIDKEGNIIWERTFGGRYEDVLKTGLITESQEIVIGGTTNSPSSDHKLDDNLTCDFWIIKLNENGDVIWEETFGGNGTDELFSLVVTQDGNYLAAGSSNSSFAKDGSDIWLLKIGSLGNLLWEQTYNFGPFDQPTSLVEDSDNTIIIGVSSKSTKKVASSEQLNDFVLMKLSEEGDQKWSKSVGSGGRDLLRKAFITRDGGYLMVGMSNASRPNRARKKTIGKTDFWAVKLYDKEKKKPEKLPLEAFPNPTSSYTNVVLGYDYVKGTATVYDLGGRLLNSITLNGNRTIPINLSGLPIGAYIIHVTTDVQENGVKIIKN
ncbi:T9SS type A sorting domain-containing protein [Flavobacterium sp. NST-5]|uniref:T9SS type A sorting domain-containing protein n=1 Tax=Flavobacterium ichthyis TaxID=2698827 RepID=A0ABW9ZB36_9FLAO|nr:T9SS type A sorting domain-containing protein [Flavobacterium ichthyis]NBL64527.1 T9SS type A sorting domain-containing protein [Flavobacterium ichthyis]